MADLIFVETLYSFYYLVADLYFLSLRHTLGHFVQGTITQLHYDPTALPRLIFGLDKVLTNTHNIFAILACCFDHILRLIYHHFLCYGFDNIDFLQGEVLLLASCSKDSPVGASADSMCEFVASHDFYIICGYCACSHDEE